MFFAFCIDYKYLVLADFGHGAKFTCYIAFENKSHSMTKPTRAGVYKTLCPQQLASTSK